MNVCVIGVGRLGSALLQGWKKAGVKLSAVSRHGMPPGVKEATMADATKADVVVVAVKPKDIPEVLQQISIHWQTPGPLIVSVAVQPDLTTLQAHLPAGTAVARAMPNIACAAGLSVTAFATGLHASAAHQAQLQAIWDACGHGIAVQESQLVAATALSGCGPAYAFRFIQALSDAGKDMGLEENQAEQMARGVLQSAAGLMNQEPGKTMKEWIGQVATPGGTTEAALKTWDENGFGRVVAQGLFTAYNKNKPESKK